MKSSLGIVVIGRNEGDRLVRCLDSLRDAHTRVVYVDSCSTDDSVSAARQPSVEVVEIDPSRPLSAARSRNEGVARLLQIQPDTAFVQFVDGDCEILPGWLDVARRTLEERTDAAAVCGGLRERRREATIYNRLCDMEWSGTPGDVSACGGVSMMRVAAFSSVGGFRSDMSFGEEPELCLRLRRAGWRIVRVDHPMALHDAAMTRFGQWWRRATRTGHAALEGASLHGSEQERHNVHRVRSVLLWAVIVPVGLVASLVLACWTGHALLGTALFVLGYVALAARIFLGRRRRGDRTGDAFLYTVFCILSKWAALWGMITYLRNRRLERQTPWVECKST